MDRISNLPDEIICHIGSFLSAKDAAFAMVLSKRWRNLFTIVGELRFSKYIDSKEGITDFEDRVLALPVNSRVRKFFIEWCYKDSEHAHINRCLCHVLKLGILILELCMIVEEDEEDEVYSLPLEVFTCKTVTELKLGYGFAIDFLPADAYLPALKTLCLDSIRFSGSGRFAFNRLLSAAPVLEELVVEEDGEFERWNWSFTVSSLTLRRLTIQRHNWESYDDYAFESIILDTPSLTYLHHQDFVPKKYSFVNLKSLVEAELDLCVGRWEQDHADDFDPTNLIDGLKNAEILDLTDSTMQMIYVFRNVIPVFKNLFRLSVGFSKNFWLSLPILLKKSPNLKTLIITGPLEDHSFEEVYVCEGVLSCPVEVLKIMYYRCSIRELEQVKQLLEKLSFLELVEVHVQVSDEKRVRVMDDLLMLPRASTKCKIKVKFL